MSEFKKFIARVRKNDEFWVKRTKTDFDTRSETTI